MLLYAVLIVFARFFVLPLLWMFVTAIKPAVTAVPVLILFMFLQRYIVQSVAMSGLKG